MNTASFARSIQGNRAIVMQLINLNVPDAAPVRVFEKEPETLELAASLFKVRNADFTDEAMITQWHIIGKSCHALAQSYKDFYNNLGYPTSSEESKMQLRALTHYRIFETLSRKFDKLTKSVLKAKEPKTYYRVQPRTMKAPEIGDVVNTFSDKSYVIAYVMGWYGDDCDVYEIASYETKSFNIEDVQILTCEEDSDDPLVEGIRSRSENILVPVFKVVVDKVTCIGTVEIFKDETEDYNPKYVYSINILR